MALNYGTAFYFNNRPGDNHLRFVITDPSLSEVLVVNVTTPRGSRPDLSCVLTSADCSELDRASRIAYEYAEIIDREELEQLIADGKARFVMDVPNATLSKIWNGAIVTPHLTLRHAEFMREQGLLP